MPKIKRDQLTAESNHEGSSSIQDKQLEDDEEDHEQTQPKKKRFNFSIESILREVAPRLSCLSKSSESASESRSPSPTLSRVSPVSSISNCSQVSSRASTPISPGANHQSDDCKGNAQSADRSSAATKKVASAAGGWSEKRAHNGASTNQLLRQRACSDPRLAPFECHLDNLDLWHRFHPLDTEMIITKQGRRMFPPVRVTFSLGDGRGGLGEQQGQQQAMQLNSRDKYQVLMDILPYDNKRYRYAYHKSSWQQAGKADPPSPTKLFLHPDGPFTLDQLKRQVISFEKIKLTNNDANKHGYIVLNSMHKYQPRIHLVLWRGKESQNLANAPISQLEQETHKTFIFSETIFTAVTAYQNHSITKLKIDSNPFAKGFRDSSRLTDLELDSIQDLMADGQCPFSPPRAPPHGFPHFLFAQQAAGNQMPEDSAAALLRDRAIMALDSFLQQQQQQQQPSSTLSPHQQPPVSFPSATPAFGAYLGGPAASSANKASGPQQSAPANFEQLIMQQQQQFAAAMAAAAAASNATHPALHGLFGPPGQPAFPAQAANKPAGSPGHPQLSPISSKPDYQANNSFLNEPQGGATGNSFPQNQAFQPHQHLQAMMAAHHKHQMAALSIKLDHRQQPSVSTANQAPQAASKFVSSGSEKKNLSS